MAVAYTTQVWQLAIFPPLLQNGQPVLGPKGGVKRIKVTIGKATLTHPASGAIFAISCVCRKGLLSYGITAQATGSKGLYYCPNSGNPRPVAYPLGTPPAPKPAHSSMGESEFIRWATLKVGGQAARTLAANLATQIGR